MKVIDWSYRWPNFEPKEVLSPDGLAQFKNGNLLIQEFAMDFLQEFRWYLDHPLVCNSGNNIRRGYRSPRENMKVGGAEFSRHMQGIAFDLTCPSLSFSDFVCKTAQFRHKGRPWGYIKTYEKMNFIHCDVRPIIKGAPLLCIEDT